MPKCEICRAAYSAKIKIGKTRVCFSTLCNKVKELGASEIIQTLMFLFGLIMVLMLAIDVLVLVKNFFFGTSELLVASLTKILGSDYIIVGIFKGVVFPVIFYKRSEEHLRKRMKLWEDSIVQIV